MPVHKTSSVARQSDYERLAKTKYASNSYTNVTKEAAKDSTGYVVTYKSLKDPTTTQLVDSFSTKGVLRSHTELCKNGTAETTFTAGPKKGDKYTLFKSGKSCVNKKNLDDFYYDKTGKLTDMFVAKEGKAYIYQADGNIKSIADFNKDKDYFFNGKAEADSIISHKKDAWKGNGVRIK